MKKLLALAVMLTAVASQAFAAPGAGFETTSCALSADELPGTYGNTVVVAKDSALDTIQEGIDAAQAGSTIVIKNGVYHEEAVVPPEKPGLRIRGESRDGVILDGLNDANSNGVADAGETFLTRGITAFADNVVMENMTGRRYNDTAFYWTHQTGYWGRHLTAYNNERYGIYAYDSRCGQFNDSYVSGNADGGFYIGECFPCDAVITDSYAYENALGYSGTNAGGRLIIRDSKWVGNALGIAPNSLTGEERPPQRGATINNNVIEGPREGRPGQSDVPGVGFAGTYWGVGIAIAGGWSNHIYGNTISGQEFSGIVLTPLPDTGSANDNPTVFISQGNLIHDNTVSGSGYADLAQALVSGPGNCWTDNTFGTSAPAVGLQEIWNCETMPITPPGGDPSVEALLVYQTANPQGERSPGFWATWEFAPPADALDYVVSEADTAPLTEWLPALF